MSAWSNINGKVQFSKEDHKCSLRRLVEEIYDECVVQVSHLNKTDYTINVSYSLENEKAFDVAKSLVDQLKEYDKNVKVDLTLTIRYLT
jgi:hypothetical protein